MFGRFTERAQKVLVYSQEAAQEFSHGYVGTEHILMGILTEEGAARNILNKMNIKLDDVKELIDEYEGYGDKKTEADQIPLTPRTKRLLELSLMESRTLNHNYIAPEHMLLAMISEPEGVAVTILSSLGADFQRIKKELIDNLNGDQSGSPSDTGAAENSDTPALDQFRKGPHKDGCRRQA